MGAVKQRPSDFKPQELSNTAWAFAATCQLEEHLLAVLAMAALQSLCESNAQSLANIAWAFARTP